MKICDRYVARAILAGYAVVLALLVGLFSISDVVRELDDVGKGRYELMDVFVVVAMAIPRRMADLSSVSALMGTILALGALAGRHELLVMRASGISPLRMVRSGVLASLPVVLLVAALLEIVAPPLERMAIMRRNLAVLDARAAQTEKGFWFRDGFRMVRVGSVLQGRVPADIIVFTFDDNRRLIEVIRAPTAEIVGGRTWVLRDAERTPMTSSGPSLRLESTLSFETELRAEDIGLVRRSPESLAPSALYQQVRARRTHALSADQFEFVLWQKVSMPFATPAMIALGVPFVLGSVRSVRFGRRIALGAVVGVAAYFLTQIIGHIGTILALNPIVIGFSPVIGIATIAGLLLCSQR